MVARNVAYHFRQQQRGFVSWWHVLQKECREYVGPADLVTLLLEAKDPETGQMMNDRDIVNNLFTFIAAGHETTALALTWTFYLLSRHPEIEQLLVDEIASVTGGGPLAVSRDRYAIDFPSGDHS